MRLRVWLLFGLAASVVLSRAALAADKTSQALQTIEGQMSRLGIQGEADDVSCTDWVAAWTQYRAYMNSHPDDAEAKQLSGQEPNIPAVATLAEAEGEAQQHFSQLNNVRIGNGLASLSPTDGLFPLQEAITAVCTDTSHPFVPHTLAFAAYAAFAAAAGDLDPVAALNAPPPPAPDAATANVEQQTKGDKSFPGAPLTSAERDSINDEIRECWTIDSGAEGIQSMQVMLNLTTDANGTVRRATVATADRRRAGEDLIFNGFAERAVRAALDYRCSTLPLPPTLAGKPQTLTILFSP